ncbi:hypothetical protein K32_10070 [Kaistia sp. 32K]|nr:hypothetical protein K32_10070 [Kaistia sp. 32K]
MQDRRAIPDQPAHGFRQFLVRRVEIDQRAGRHKQFYLPRGGVRAAHDDGAFAIEIEEDRKHG